MKRKEETWLPLFPGFYGTTFKADEEFEMEIINGERNVKGLKPLDFDDFIFDYDAYHNDVAKKCVQIISDKLVEMCVIDGIKFENLSQPREYNFANDNINVEITFSEKARKKLLNFILIHLDSFAEYISEKYSSRSGFISYYSSNASDWLVETNNLKKIPNKHMLGAILDWAIRFQLEYIDNEDSNEWLRDNIVNYPNVQVIDWDEAINKVK